MNKTEKITLTDNHKRSISSSLRTVDKSLDELKKELVYQNDLVMHRITRSLAQDDITECLAVIEQIRSYISYLKAKYDLESSVTDITRMIHAKKSTLWDILVDTSSSRLKGYGEFPAKHAKEFDSDLNELIALVNKL